MKPYSSDVAFSDEVKKVQTERGSRSAYARVEKGGGFRTEVTDELRQFLEMIDTAYVATSADGQPYIQHRGGPKGFIRAVDDHTLGLVDFAGNRQYISTGNLRTNDRVCLFLMDYAHRRRVKIWGSAKMVPLTDALLDVLADPTYKARPEQVLLITVEAWDVNCPQHIPQKLDADDVARAIEPLQRRIKSLEAELAALKARG